MAQLFINNFATTLSQNLGASDTQMTVVDASSLPALTAEDYILMTLFRVSGVDESGHEVVKVTARTGNLLTIERSIEGAAASLFLTHDHVEARLTAGSLKNLQPLPINASTTSVTALTGQHYVLTNAGLTTVTLPASPSGGDNVQVTVSNGRTDNVIARNGNTIGGAAENLILDNVNATVYLVYLANDWKLTGITDEVNVAAAASALSSANSATASALSAQEAADVVAATVDAVVSALDNGAPVWVTGTTYTYGQVAWSPISLRVYRRIVAGAGTVDPSADGVNWAIVGTATLPMLEVTGTSITATNGVHYFLTNASSTSVTLPFTPVLGDTIAVSVCNGRTDNVIVRNGQTLMGLAENMTMDNALLTISLKYINGDWRMI